MGDASEKKLEQIRERGIGCGLTEGEREATRREIRER